MDPQEFYRAKCDALIKQFEGFEAEPYLDGVGVPTIGYGATTYEDGTPVTMNDAAISQARGEELYNHHLILYDKLSLIGMNLPLLYKLA